MRYGYAIRKPKIYPVKAKREKIAEILSLFAKDKRYVAEEKYYVRLDQLKAEVRKRTDITSTQKDRIVEHLNDYEGGLIIKPGYYDIERVKREDLVLKYMRLNSIIQEAYKKLDKVSPPHWKKDGNLPYDVITEIHKSRILIIKIGNAEFTVTPRYIFMQEWIRHLKDLPAHRFV